jgi:hypothetical protein
MKNLALLGLVLSLAACPGPGEGGTSLVGTWEELPSPTSEGDVPGVATFRDDGTFEIDEDGELQTGTFEETADTLILTNDTGTVEELPYAIDGQRFTPIGLRHLSGAGFAGEWLAEGLSDGEPTAMQLVLGEDSRFTLDIGDQDTLTGSWREDAGELITTLEVIDNDGQVLTFELPWHSIDGTVSVIAYERR